MIEAGTRDAGKLRGRGGGWKLSRDNFKVNDYNARTESCYTKESTPTKDTSTTVAQPRSRFMQWNQFKSKCPSIIPNQVKQQSTKHKLRQELEMQANREEEAVAGS